jgi:hypothetical protein
MLDGWHCDFPQLSLLAASSLPAELVGFVTGVLTPLSAAAPSLVLAASLLCMVCSNKLAPAGCFQLLSLSMV